MRLLVTGGAGFIGSHFVNFVLSSPTICQSISKLTVLDDLTYASDLKRLNSIKEDLRFSFVKGSILNSDLVSGLVEEHDLVFNFAAETHVDNSISSPNIFVQTNILGVQILINSLIGKKGKRLVHVSTDEVYGEKLTGSSTESDILNPSSPYSASKAAAEMLILAAARTYGLNYTITRGSNTFGPGQFPEKIIPKFIRCAAIGEEVPVYGDGKQSREWLHATDHANGIWLAGIYSEPNMIFNIGSGVEMTNLELIEVINSIRPDFQLRAKFVDDRPGHDRRYSLDSSRASALLNFEPRVSFMDGIRMTLHEELSKL
jgi:dTDP-glucose 4,6-dehydratase